MPAGKIAISWPIVFLNPSLEVRKIFFITIPAVLIFLVALELCLRLCGYLYVQGHNPGAYGAATESSKDEFRILCLGDSHTFGIGANPESSYPRQLEKILQKNISKKLSVINEGRLANTSSLLLKKLPADIHQYSPSMIVVLTGINNSWNLEDSSYFSLHGGSMSFFEKLEKSLSSLRTYKLLKIGFLNLKSKKEINQKAPVDNDLHRKIDQRSVEPRNVAESLYRAGKYDSAIEKAKEALKIDSTDYAVHLILAQALLGRGNRQSAKEELWKTIRLVKEWNANLVSGIVIISMLINPDDDLVLFKKYLQENVEKKKGDALIEMVEAGLGLRKDEKIFKAVLDYDLGQIVSLAERKGIKLVLQTYPGDRMDLVNGVIIAASQKYNTQLVDNEMIFKEKTRNEFFVADGHCNGKGYGLMAENIYETLLTNGMLPVGSAGVRGDGR